MSCNRPLVPFGPSALGSEAILLGSRVGGG
jgi:hypothetical protein